MWVCAGVTSRDQLDRSRPTAGEMMSARSAAARAALIGRAWLHRPPSRACGCGSVRTASSLVDNVFALQQDSLGTPTPWAAAAAAATGGYAGQSSILPLSGVDELMHARAFPVDEELMESMTERCACVEHCGARECMGLCGEGGRWVDVSRGGSTEALFLSAQSDWLAVASTYPTVASSLVLQCAAEGMVIGDAEGEWVTVSSLHRPEKDIVC